jgi:putative aldouronate transport system permease protein
MRNPRSALPVMREPELPGSSGRATPISALRRLRLRLTPAARNWVLYLMFAPLAAYMVVFAYVPMAGLVVAFKEYN